MNNVVDPVDNEDVTTKNCADNFLMVPSWNSGEGLRCW